MLCDRHRADYHFTGETCMETRHLEPGDQVAVLTGVGCATVRAVAEHAEPGWLSVLLDVSCDGPTPLSADTVLNVRRRTTNRPDPR